MNGFTGTNYLAFKLVKTGLTKICGKNHTSLNDVDVKHS